MKRRRIAALFLPALLLVSVTARADVLVGPMIAALVGLLILLAAAVSAGFLLMKYLLLRFLQLDKSALRTVLRINLVLLPAAVLAGFLSYQFSFVLLGPILALLLEMAAERLLIREKCPEVLRYSPFLLILDAVTGALLIYLLVQM